ncbi:MAG: DUF3108 domain-containing protein [Bryobacteraceae bacterium]
MVLPLAALGFNQSASSSDSRPGEVFPFPEELVYRVDWRLITAGTATLDLKSTSDHTWQTKLNIQSAGMVSRLYRVMDTYDVKTDSKFCLVSSELNAEENKRHVVARTWMENSPKLRYEERDLVKNSTVEKELDVPSCTREIVGALASLRLLRLEPGKSTTIPVTDGKKVVSARIESQAREELSFEGKKYQTVRYEAFLFDNVLYRRRGRLFVWITEDGERIPVQIRLQLGFPIGNVTIQLEKRQRNPG